MHHAMIGESAKPGLGQTNPGAFLIAICMAGMVAILWLRRGMRSR